MRILLRDLVGDGTESKDLIDENDSSDDRVMLELWTGKVEERRTFIDITEKEIEIVTPAGTTIVKLFSLAEYASKKNKED